MKQSSLSIFLAICVLYWAKEDIKEDILKNVGNQTVDGSHWLLLHGMGGGDTMQVNRYRQLFG